MSFAIRRSRRARRPRVTIDDAGEVVVVLPIGVAARLADELVERHAAWIERHRRPILEEQRILAARPPIGQGRSVPLRGLPHDVYIERAAGRRRSSIALEAHSSPAIVIRLADPDQRPVKALLERWLRRQARADLWDAVVARSGEMGVRGQRLTVRDQRTRWGSASRRGTLSFSWRLVLCPPEVLDYVVVHELAHLRVAGHTNRFWALVRRHAPSADHHRRWLRRNERRLRRALD